MSVNGMPTGTAVYFAFSMGKSQITITTIQQQMNVSIGTDFSPSYEDSTYTDLTIFMPYQELHLSKYQSKIIISIYDNYTGEVLTHLKNMNFLIVGDLIRVTHKGSMLRLETI